MNRCITLLSTLFMAAISFPALAGDREVAVTEWKDRCFYYLESNGRYIALDGMKADSLIAKSIQSDASKVEMDSALWQITGKTVSGALVYEFKNKATGALLSLPSSGDGNMTLDPGGISSWTFSYGKIVGYYGTDKSLALSIQDGALISSETDQVNTSFEVIAPKSDYRMKASELGAGISVFHMQLTSSLLKGNEPFAGDIFSGKELIAKDLSGMDEGYVTLQYKGDETFGDGKVKFLGVDTTRTTIDGAQDVFGYNFVVDSTYAVGNKHSYGNADYQKFSFTIDLKNDSIAMFVKGAPYSPNTATEEPKFQVVFASYENTKRLTVSKVSTTIQGTAPLITTTRGEAAKLSNGYGVYFLKDAGSGNNGYLYAPGDLRANEPSDYLSDGQWLVKETDGKYSIVERNSNRSYATNAEIFPVNGLENTFTVAGKSDSLTFVYRDNIDSQDRYLGVKHISDSKLKEKELVLSINAVGGSAAIVASDTLLVAQAGNDNAVKFRAVKAEESIAGGAQSIGDTLYSVSYYLKDISTGKFIVDDIDKPGTLVLSENKGQTNIAAVTFTNTSTADSYILKVGDKSISYDAVKGNLILGDEGVDFNIELLDNPEYATIASSHIRLESNGKYLTMNPYTSMAEMKNEGQEITKATYSSGNFSLKVETADTVIAGKPVYKISTRVFDGSENSARYYLAAIDTVKSSAAVRIGFTADTVKVPAGLFAFKVIDSNDGTVVLENIRTRSVVALSNNALIESNDGLVFNIEKALAPTAVEVVKVEPAFKAVGGHNEIIIMNAKGKKAVITDILGKLVGNYRITSDRFSVKASRGINIVAVDSKIAQKVIVK